MSFKTTAAPCALLLAALSNAGWTSPVLAQQTPEPALLDSVIVTGRRNAEDPAVVAEARALLSRTPGAVAVVASETYQDRYALTFADTLRSVPGVFAQRRWGEEVRLSIRGSGIGNSAHLRGVLLAQDGVPFNAPDGFGEFQEIDPLIARHIDVFKGGNALRFGGAALGGAINVVTPTGRTAASQNLIRVEGGSFDTLRGHVALARDWGDWDLYAAATVASSDGFRDNQSSDSKRLTLNLGRSFGEGRELRLIVQGNDLDQSASSAVTRQQALNNPTAVPANNTTLAFARDVKSLRSTLLGRWRVDDSLAFEGAVYVVDKDLYHPISIVIDQNSLQWGGYGRLDWNGRLGGMRADAYAGISYRGGTTDAFTFVAAGGARPGAKIGDSVQDATGIDAFAEGRLFVTDRLALVAGGSYGRAERDYTNNLAPANNAETTFDWFAPRIGLLWEDETGAQIYANLTRSVEAPSYGALVQGTVPQFVPVDIQDAWTAEVGARGRRGPFTYDISAYRAQIEGELLNYSVNPALNIPAATFNADDTIHQGIEAGLDWRIIDSADGRLTLRQTYAWSDFFFENDRVYGDNRLPVVPEHLYRAELKYAHPAGWFVAPSVEWSPTDVLIDYANTRSATDGTPLTAPDYAILSFNAGWSLRGGLSLFLDARNLTDERYISTVNAVTDATKVATAVFVPGEGRSAYVGVRYAF
ncbi:iron complex outermembrane receptor protein [Brevundimonas vesicularis]|uniref:Iron complex outermembrane receptor protein n=1 Tax=Brevundimonas vesicularis TaxID=41276 RepID=A0A7W9FTE1_BREVE|nr:TonB-dependent receptor [Brevundimonas vesicularis]MBB5771230.1 iron complex outermembrane receptor protein [Brevundimonas vesicularis]